MKIENKEPGSKDYYDEYLYIALNYKKLKDNSNKKVKKLSNSAYLYFMISTIIFILFLLWYLSTKDWIQLSITIFFGLLTILSMIYITLIKKRILLLIRSYSKTTFEITKDHILVENKIKKYSLKWNELDRILLNNDTILWIPKDEKNDFIITRIEYKEEIIKTLKNLKKEHLIVN
ncbi:MAG: hypothetical protein IKE70_01415 [Bacilli bacterium]|nr:hypothetical protein [Bacilli bacterium]